MLALYGVNVTRTRLAAQGIHDCWASVRNKLGCWQRASTIFTDTAVSRIEVSECLVLVPGPILSLVNEDFESLEADFSALKAQIEQANADVEHFFTMCDERPR